MFTKINNKFVNPRIKSAPIVSLSKPVKYKTKGFCFCSVIKNKGKYCLFKMIKINTLADLDFLSVALEAVYYCPHDKKKTIFL